MRERVTREEAEKLITTSPRLLSRIDQQRRYLAQLHLIPIRCPNCREPLAEVDAMHRGGDNYQCVHCYAKLIYTVPLIATPSPWYWTLAPGQINMAQKGA